MERLYAVPSEKLRVWSVWLTKIGEIADEWQKWLRAHIDLAVRLADHLRAAEEAIRGPKEEEEQGVSAEDDGMITPGTVHESVQDVARDEKAEAVDEDQFRELYTAGEAGAKSTDDIDAPRDEETGEPPEKSVEGPPSTESAEPSDVTLTPDSVEPSDATLTPESEGGEEMVWPIGIPWQPTGPPPKVEPEPEPLPLPRDEEEMRQFLKEFTHQATIYRSYYKHWNKTADQAIKEIGGRVVMATYKIRGEGVPAGKKRLRSQASRYLSVSKAKFRSKRKISKSKSRSIGRVEPAEPVTEPAEQESVESAEGGYFALNASTSDTPTVIENPPNPSPSNQKPTPARSSNGTSKPQLKMEPSTESVEVDDWVRDNARASEPIPYLFYLKAEPDIQIAIEHDDELVIDADPDRESIAGCYARLFYNLKDKPCKGGKPWI
ncbi:uncharacterized protein LOC143374739 isoform X2 [Andrena cerasifolii]